MNVYWNFMAFLGVCISMNKDVDLIKQAFFVGLKEGFDHYRHCRRGFKF